MKGNYTIIVPRADRTGPSNVAVDIGHAAALSGWQVRLLYLSGSPTRDDVTEFSEVRKFRVSDLWRLSGIVHTHGLRPDCVGWLFSWSGRCKVASTLHGHFPQHLTFDYANWKVLLAWFAWSRALRRFALRVCISRTMCRHYRRTLPRMHFELAYNFRPSNNDDASHPSYEILRWLEQQRAHKRVVLTYVGSLTSRKNILPLVRYVAKSTEFSLVVCGQGPLADALVSEVRNSERGAILYAGQLLSPDSVVRMSDLLVLPSSAEGLPLVVLEAARLGVPSLLSNIAVHRELAATGLGLTFNHRSYVDFRAKALALSQTRSPESDEVRKAVWRNNFSPEIGFARYEHLLAALRLDMQGVL